MMRLISLVLFPRISIFSLTPSGTIYAIDHTSKVNHRSVATNLQVSFQSPELLKLVVSKSECLYLDCNREIAKVLSREH